jgi:hypothetical protein
MTDRLIKILTFGAFFALLPYIIPIYAADEKIPDKKHSEKEIRGIIAMVQQELDGVKKSKAGEIADKDVKLIEMSLIKTKNLLDQKKIEDAYYQIEITRAIFTMIDARLELYNSKQLLEQLKTRKATAP